MGLKRGYLVWVILVAFSSALISSCATPEAPKPRVMLPAASYPQAVNVAGVTVAAVPFDPNRDIYAAPDDPHPRKPDFNWFKAGICPVRLIFDSDTDVPYVVNPLQITGADAAGVTYRPYTPKEAGDAVVASEAFATFARGAVAGTILGAALGAALGATVGGLSGGGRAAATGAAIGAGFGGAEGLLVGSGFTRSQLEDRVRHLLYTRTLPIQTLGRGMFCDGLVYFPAVNITSIRIILAEADGPGVLDLKIPVVMALPAPPVAANPNNR